MSSAGLQRGAQVLDAFDQVVHVDVVRVHVDVAEPLHQQLHRLDAVVDPALEHLWLRTVMPRSKSLFIARLGDAGDLARVVEVRVQHDLLVAACARARPRAVSASIQASSVRIFCGMTAGPLVAKRMRRMFASPSSVSPMCVICSAPQLVGVAAGDDDVLELGPRGDVSKACCQRSALTLSWNFSTSSVSMPTA